MARYFVGASSQNITCTDIAAINGASALTMTFWGKRAASSNAVYMGKYTGSTIGIWMEAHADGNFYFNIRNGGATFGYMAHNVITLNHYAFVFNGGGATNADRVKGYINGALQTLSFVGPIPSTVGSGSGTFNIGLASTEKTTGTIADVRVYTAALSEKEVYMDYLGMLQRNLLAYWRLGVADPEPDWGGGQYNGTLVNGPTIVAHPPVGLAWPFSDHRVMPSYSLVIPILLNNMRGSLSNMRGGFING